MTSLNKDFQVRHTGGCMPWCGPAAMSAIMGITTSEARDLVKTVSLRRFIKAVTYTEMNGALMAAGYRTNMKQFPRYAKECPTLKDWMATRDPDADYIVCITGHWIAIRGEWWVCNMNRFGRHLDDCPYLRAKVRCVVKVLHKKTLDDRLHDLAVKSSTQHTLSSMGE